MGSQTSKPATETKPQHITVEFDVSAPALALAW